MATKTTAKRTKPPAKSARPPAKSAKPPAKSARPPAKSAKPPAKSAKPPAKNAKPPAKAKAAPKKVVLLAGGNPQIAKGDGDGPVQAYLAAIQDWKRGVGERIDAVIVRAVPGVRKAVKWNSPFYGVEGQGWFLSFHVFTKYVKVSFFKGAELRPLPPGASSQPDVRYLDLREGELDERQLAAWVKQAAALPGWMA